MKKTSEEQQENRDNPLPKLEAEPPRVIIQWQKALMWHSLGFLTIVLLTWCEELFYFMHQMLGRAPQEANFREAAIKTLVIVLVWASSALGIYRLVARLSYLEKFLQVCAWCRKIHRDGQWVTLEAHFASQTGNKVSHGICPECANKFGQKF